MCSALLICSMAAPCIQAESTTYSGPITNALSASARLGLRVVIPRFLFFQVGSRGNTVDTLTFQPPPESVGDGSTVNATGGNAASGNAGQITITATNDGGGGGLGSAGAISLAEISTSSDTPELAAPILTDPGGDTSRATVTHGNVTDLNAIWRYEYRNLHAVDPGTYRAEIIYTAASP